MNNNLYFVSKDANWQHYRNEVLTYLSKKYDLKVEILTTGTLKSYLHENRFLKYKLFKNYFSESKKFNFFPGAIIYIIKNKPRFVLALNNAANLTEYVTCLMCFFMKTKFIWWTHGYDHKPVKGWLKRKIKNLYTLFFFKMGDSIITFSEAGKTYLVNIGIKEDKIFVAPNTLDTEKLLSVKDTIVKSFDRNQFIIDHFNNVRPEAKFILFSGRINKFKKVDNLIKALPIVMEKVPTVHLIIIGDGEQRGNVEKLTRELALTDKVHFIGPLFDDVEVGKYFVLSDVFVIPGLVGLAIVHAFCYGRPLITENVSYHSPEIQYLRNNYNGFMVEENDLQQMADKILLLLQNDDKLNEMKINCEKTIETDANILAMTTAMYNALLH